jgi:hypothetical protein
VPGDVVVLGCASHLNELKDALAGQAEIASVDVTTLDASTLEPSVHEERRAAELEEVVATADA